MGCFASKPPSSTDSTGFSSLSSSSPRPGDFPQPEGGQRYKNGKSAGNSTKDNFLPFPNYTQTPIVSLDFLSFSSSSGLLNLPHFLSGTESGEIPLFSLPSKENPGKHIKSYKGHDRSITRLFVDSQRQRFFSSSRDKSIRAWKISLENAEGKEKEEIAQFQGHTLPITGLTQNSCDPNEVCSGSRDFTVRWWDFPTGQEKFQSEVQQNVVTGIYGLPKENSLYLQISEDLSGRIWDSRCSLHQRLAASWADGPYFALAADLLGHGENSSSDFFLTTHNGFESTGCEIRLWDRRKLGSRPFKEFSPSQEISTGAEENFHTQAVFSGKFLDGQHFLTISKDSTMKLWTFSECLQTVALEPEFSPISLGISYEDEKFFLVALGSASGKVSFWEISRKTWEIHCLAKTSE